MNKHLIYGHGLINVDDIAFISDFYESPHYPYFDVIFNNTFGRHGFGLRISMNYEVYTFYSDLDCSRKLGEIDFKDVPPDIRDCEFYKEFKYSYLRLVEKFKEV